MRSIVLGLLGLLVVGCSTSRERDLDDGGAPPSDATTAVDSARPAGDAAATTDDAGTPPTDGGEHAPDARVVDGGAPPAGGRIVCGTLECDAATHGCLASCLYATDERMPACVEMDADGRWPAAECPTGREMFPRYWLTCDGAEDCPSGESCHMLHGSLGQYAYCDSCEPPCDLRWFNMLCRTDADCPAEAPRCLATADLPGYSTCQEGG